MTVALCDALRGSSSDLVVQVGQFAAQRHSADASVLLSVARMYLDSNRFADAQNVLVAAGKQAPRDGDIYRWLGETLLRRGDADRAEKVLAARHPARRERSGRASLAREGARLPAHAGEGRRAGRGRGGGAHLAAGARAPRLDERHDDRRAPAAAKGVLEVASSRRARRAAIRRSPCPKTHEASRRAPRPIRRRSNRRRMTRSRQFAPPAPSPSGSGEIEISVSAAGPLPTSPAAKPLDRKIAPPAKRPVTNGAGTTPHPARTRRTRPSSLIRATCSTRSRSPASTSRTWRAARGRRGGIGPAQVRSARAAPRSSPAWSSFSPAAPERTSSTSTSAPRITCWPRRSS